VSRLPPFEQILDRYGADVWRFAASQLGQAHADDIFQETMLAALAAYPEVRKPDSIKSWLLRITARKVVDFARAQARAPVPAAVLPEPPAQRSGVQQPELPDEDLWARVRALPPKQRQAVALRTVLDLPYDEIASTMQTSVEAARRNVHEALRTLREEVTNDHAHTRAE
jgi:RNA polymerase sigma factor (sigma-70 family)